MSIRFNADEILKIAERIEGNASAFYRKAADLHPSPHNKDFLYQLAAMEDQHAVTFAALRVTLSKAEREETAYDPMDQQALYLKALADQHGGEGTTPASRLTGRETMEQLLKLAIELEHKSILFYGGIRDLVPANLGQDKIDQVIQEEKKHVVTLSRELNKARQG